MIFNDSKMIVLLGSKGLFLMREDRNYQLDFPTNVVKNQDVINSGGLNKLLIDFLSQEKINPQSAVLLLAPELLYEKNILALSPEEAQQKFDSFLVKIPFTQISKIKIFDADKIHVIATNAHLWTLIKDGLEKIGWKIELVLPAPAVGILGATLKNKEEAQTALQKLDDAKRYNFLNKAPDVNQPILSPGKSQVTASLNKVWWIGGLIIALVAIIGIPLIFYRNQMMIVKPDIKTVELPTPTIIQKAVSPNQVMVNKTDLTIEVLNGSGVAGQAGKVKSILEKVGFLNITADNYRGLYKGGTVVKYSTRVSEDLHQEIVRELNKSIANVSAESTSGGKFDVTILIGK